MNTTERQQSLAAARRACNWLISNSAIQADDRLWEQIACLMRAFWMLDAKEQNQIAAGAKGAEYGKLGAKHGKKGGRPRKTNGGKNDDRGKS